MCCESLQRGGDSAAITRELRLKVQVETFGNLDLLIVNMLQHLAKVAHRGCGKVADESARAKTARESLAIGPPRSVIFKETGSFTETMRRLYAHETKPHAIRLSTAQTRYIDRNFDEFVQAHGTVIRAWTEHYTEKIPSRSAGQRDRG
jgi:hypothetical protein